MQVALLTSAQLLIGFLAVIHLYSRQLLESPVWRMSIRNQAKKIGEQYVTLTGSFIMRKGRSTERPGIRSRVLEVTTGTFVTLFTSV